MALGGLGVSLAGFAGLISALDRRPAAQSAVVASRIRTIVFLGFTLTFAAFGTIALYTVTGADLTMTVRVATLILAAPFLRLFPRDSTGNAVAQCHCTVAKVLDRSLVAGGCR